MEYDKGGYDTTHNLHVIRDATRGGVGTVLYEIAGQSNVGIRLNAAAVPVQPEVKAFPEIQNKIGFERFSW